MTSLDDKKIIEDTIFEEADIIKKKEVYIFGCTVFSRDIRDALNKIGCIATAFLDNSVKKVKEEKYCLGIPIIFPRDLDVNNENIVVIVCSKFSHEMINQLIELGLEKSKVLKIAVEEDIPLYEDSENDFEKAREVILQGYKIYCDLLNANENCEKIFLCPYPGTGDIYYACSLLDRYLKEKKINNYIVVVPSNASEKAARLFVDCKIIVLERKTIGLLLKYWEFEDDQTVIKPLAYWGWRTKRYIFAENCTKITFSEMFAYDVFGYEEPVLFKKPRQEEIEKTKQLFKGNNYKIGKTVVLSPYAGSFVSELKSEFWEKLACRLIKEGYCVLTNSCGVEEPVIKGTKPVFFNFNQAINFMNLAGYFVGVRNGLCDIISSSNCKKVILYEDSMNVTRFSYFSLEKMGLCLNNIFETSYSKWLISDSLEEEGISLIKNYLTNNK